MMKYFPYYLISLFLLGLGIALFYKGVWFGLAVILILLAIALLAFLEFFVKPRDRREAELHRAREAEAERTRKARQAYNNLNEEHTELKGRRFNITELRNILDLGLIEVDTHFTRSWDQRFMKEKTQLRFCGALRVDLVARYGVNLKEVRFRYDESSNTLWVANAQPCFLSFSKRNLSWQLAEVLEWKAPIIGEDHWRSSKDWDGQLAAIKEKYRVEIERYTENGPQELSWVIGPLRKQIENSLEAIFSKSGCKVRMTDSFDGSFRLLSDSLND